MNTTLHNATPISPENATGRLLTDIASRLARIEDRLANDRQNEKPRERKRPGLSGDGRCLKVGDTLYRFTPAQAACVAIMLLEHGSCVPEISQSYILTEAGLENEGRLRDVFRTNDAWETLIVRGEMRGMYRLNLSLPGENSAAA